MKIRHLLLLKQFVRGNDGSMDDFRQATYKSLADRYNVSNTDIAKAKKLIRMNPTMDLDDLDDLIVELSK